MDSIPLSPSTKNPIKSLLNKYIRQNILTYEFFGKGLMGVIGCFGLNLIMVFTAIIYLIIILALIMGLYEMTLMQWVKDYQTLITGILALGAAWWTVSKMEKQINSSQQLHSDILQRKHYSERTIFPLTLSYICTYTDEYQNKIISALTSLHQGFYRAEMSEQINPPQIPFEIIERLQKLIETSTNNEFNIIIKHLIDALQVFEARNEHFRNGSIVIEEEDVLDAIAYLGFIYFLSQNLFPYARNVTNHITLEIKCGYGADIRRIRVNEWNNKINTTVDYLITELKNDLKSL